ncbi:MAG: hypothetical protein AAGF87_09655 [Bacteroidota bacterium]
MQVGLPHAFQARMSSMLGPTEASDFFGQLDGPSPVSLHHHPTKGKMPPGQDTVLWYDRGAYLPDRPSFTHDPAFQAGAYYVQEAGSMLIAWLVSQLDMPDRPWRILDLCAAPGGKSTLLAAIMPAGSVLVSNEVIKSRAHILRYNMAKWGLSGCWVTQLDPEALKPLAGFFDLVLVDAPCSGEGLFRKDVHARQEWSVENANLCAARQSRILRSAVPLIKGGGHLIYSTCTFNPEENEGQVRYLEEFGLMRVETQPPQSWGIDYRNGTHQLYPHRIRAEGFFAAALAAPDMGLAEESAMRSKPIHVPSRKKNSKRKIAQTNLEFPHWTTLPKRNVEQVQFWLDQPDQFRFYQNKQGRIFGLTKGLVAVAQELARLLPRIDLGFPIGQIKGHTLVPAPELAFHTALSKQVPSLEVDRQTAVDLMRKQTPELIGLRSGFQLITYQGLGLLWVKGIGNRYNNYWPTEWRIRT